MDSIRSQIRGICLELPGTSGSVITRLKRQNPGKDALVIDALREGLASPEGLVLRSKLVSGAINLILDHVTISPKDMPTIVYMDALTQAVQKLLSDQGLYLEVEPTLVQTKLGQCLTTRPATFRSDLAKLKDRLKPPRSIVVQDRTKYHVNASNSSANVMMGTRAYQQASAAAAAPDGFNRVLAEVRGLGSKMDAYQTSLQAVVANQGATAAQVTILQSEVSALKQESAHWQQETRGLQARIGMLEGAARSAGLIGGGARRPMITQGLGATGGLHGGGGGSMQLTAPVRHSTTSTQASTSGPKAYYDLTKED